MLGYCVFQLKDSLVSLGLRGSQCCTAVFWDWRAELCSRLSAASARRPCRSSVPTGSMTQHSAADGVPARWCLIALEQALMQNQEPSGVIVQIFNSLYYVDVTGLLLTLPCPVANLLC